MSNQSRIQVMEVSRVFSQIIMSPDNYSFINATFILTLYILTECKLYHAFEPINNEEHPVIPEDSNIACPECQDLM